MDGRSSNGGPLKMFRNEMKEHQGFAEDNRKRTPIFWNENDMWEYYIMSDQRGFFSSLYKTFKNIGKPNKNITKKQSPSRTHDLNKSSPLRKSRGLGRNNVKQFTRPRAIYKPPSPPPPIRKMEEYDMFNLPEAPNNSIILPPRPPNHSIYFLPDQPKNEVTTKDILNQKKKENVELIPIMLRANLETMNLQQQLINLYSQNCRYRNITLKKKVDESRKLSDDSLNKYNNNVEFINKNI
jgi:hypothetical protein